MSTALEDMDYSFVACGNHPCFEKCDIIPTEPSICEKSTSENQGHGTAFENQVAKYFFELLGQKDLFKVQQKMPKQHPFDIDFEKLKEIDFKQDKKFQNLNLEPLNTHMPFHNNIHYSVKFINYRRAIDLADAVNFLNSFQQKFTMIVGFYNNNTICKCVNKIYYLNFEPEDIYILFGLNKDNETHQKVLEEVLNFIKILKSMTSRKRTLDQTILDNYIMELYEYTIEQIEKQKHEDIKNYIRLSRNTIIGFLNNNKTDKILFSLRTRLSKSLDNSDRIQGSFNYSDFCKLYEYLKDKGRAGVLEKKDYSKLYYPIVSKEIIETSKRLSKKRKSIKNQSEEKKRKISKDDEDYDEDYDDYDEDYEDKNYKDETINMGIWKREGKRLVKNVYDNSVGGRKRQTKKNKIKKHKTRKQIYKKGNRKTKIQTKKHTIGYKRRQTQTDKQSKRRHIRSEKRTDIPSQKRGYKR